MLRHFIITPTPTFATHGPRIMETALKLQGYTCRTLAERIGCSYQHVFKSIYDPHESARIRDIVERLVRGEVVDFHAELSSKWKRPRRKTAS